MNFGTWIFEILTIELVKSEIFVLRSCTVLEIWSMENARKIQKISQNEALFANKKCFSWWGVNN